MLKRFLWVIALMCVSVNTLWASELSSAQSLSAKWIIKTQAHFADYRLDDTITRKEVMKIVMNLSGKNVPDTCNGTFSDVSNDWGCKYIETALSHGYIATNASFRPNDSITKAESMKLVLKARGIEKVQNTQAWQEDYMLTAYQNAIVATKYSDHNSRATRWWIFEIAATPQWSVINPSSGSTSQSSTGNQDIKSVWSYTDYSPSLIGKTNTTILFFYAWWCPSCRSADANISGEDISATDITLLKTDYDSETELLKKYGVTSQHTFVQVDASGELIKKWSWSNSLADLQSKVEVLVP